MNEAFELYLKTYSAVDKMAQMLKECEIFYVTWCCWHCPINHGKLTALTMIFEIYKMCAEGAVDNEWKINNRILTPQFCQVEGKQMCEYCAHHLNFPGVESFWITTFCTKSTCKNQRTRGDKMHWREPLMEKFIFCTTIRLIQYAQRDKIKY